MRAALTRSTKSVPGATAVELLKNRTRSLHAFPESLPTHAATRRREPILDALVQKGCRSLRFLAPSDASQVLMALADLPVKLPVQPTTLLMWVAPQLCDYTLSDVTRAFEALSQLHVSHHLVTAHLLKLVVRQLVSELASASTGVPDTSLRDTFLLPALSCVCDVVLTLRRWHTPQTLRCFLIALESAVASALVEQCASPSGGDTKSERACLRMTLFLFEAYVQYDLLTVKERADHTAASAAPCHVSDTVPFLCFALRAVLCCLSSHDADRILRILQDASGSPVAESVALTPALAREQLHAFLCPAPSLRTARPAMMAHRTEGSLCPPVNDADTDAVPLEVMLGQTCARLHTACKQADWSEAFILHTMLPLLRESRALFLRGVDCPLPYVDYGDYRRPALLFALLHLVHDLCTAMCDHDVGSNANKNGARTDLREAVGWWQEVAQRFLNKVLEAWRAALARRCASLPWHPSAIDLPWRAMPHTALLAQDWNALLIAVDLCTMLASSLPAEVPLPASCAPLTAATTREVCGVLRWMFHALCRLKETVLDRCGVAPRPEAALSVRVHLIASVLALLYYCADGALLRPGAVHAQLQTEIHTACCSVLPLAREAIEDFLALPSSPVHVCGRHAVPELSSLPALATTMGDNLVVRVQVVSHVLHATSLSRAPSLVLMDGAALDPLWLVALARQFVTHHPSLNRAVRGAAQAWVRLLSTGMSPLAHSREQHAPHSAASFFSGPSSLVAPWATTNTATPLHARSEESLTVRMDRGGALRAGLRGTLQPPRETPAAGRAAPPFSMRHSPPASRGPSVCGHTLASSPSEPFRFPSLRVFAETVHILQRGVRALTEHARVHAHSATASDLETGALEMAVCYVRLLCWQSAAAYDMLLLSSPGCRGADGLFSASQAGENTVDQVAQTLGVVVAQRADLQHVVSLLRCTGHVSAPHECADECALLATLVDAALLPGYVVRMLHPLAALAEEAFWTRLDVAAFAPHVARLARLPQRHRHPFAALLESLEIDAATGAYAYLSAWSHDTRALWSPASACHATLLTPRQLVSLVVHSTCCFADLLPTVSEGTPLSPRCSLVDTASPLPSFLRMLERDFPLFHLWHHGHFHYLSDDALVGVVQSTIGLTLLLDFVTLVDPLFASAQLTDEAQLAQAVRVKIVAVRDDLAKLHDELASSREYLDATRPLRPNSVSPAVQQVALLLKLSNHVASLVGRMLPHGA